MNFGADRPARVPQLATIDIRTMPACTSARFSRKGMDALVSLTSAASRVTARKVSTLARRKSTRIRALLINLLLPLLPPAFLPCSWDAHAHQKNAE
eukprot:scaffold53143_cov23-Tisochrysis_lutea.AAC.8